MSGPICLGEIDIPARGNMRGQRSRASRTREMLNGLTPGKASVWECADKQDANLYRSMMYTMALLKFGEAGHVCVSVRENILTVWLADDGSAGQ